ncbi:VMAP-C domain-containing protein [Kutzneria sp. CA-103260]|uniref:VMAP-C domain-containing protein n=1 Tax=Kutzneria sp. CA-103260 TaxID=2802641 RepID=UPI001BA5100C|nr:hypothetical protein [Kutzneria sp. CA-103260]QUQ62448.1 hypothetical protein JJ691_01600 [Kutzneria sp. CA-103260]
MYDQGQSGRVSLGQLVDALQEVQFLRHANERGLLLELLRHKLGRGFDPAEYSSARLHLFSIVMACDRERDGLQALVDTVRELEPESIAVDQVVALVDCMSPLALLPLVERNQLVALLEGASLPPLDELYQEVLGPAAHTLPSGHHTVHDVLSLLEQHNARADGLPLVLIFVERLAALTDETLAVKLREWVSQQAEHMDMTGPVAELRAAPPAVAAPRDGTGSLYLVMRIERDRLEDDRYVLSHWRSGGDDWQPVPGEDQVGTLDQIKRHVADLVDRAEDDWRRLPEPIQLEFLLPRDLMHLQVDQWLAANDGGVERRLGVHFELALRSLDRMRNRSWHKNWWHRWRSMSTGAPAHWCRRESANYLPELVATLADQPEICVVLLDHDVEAAAELGQDALTVALREGVPVVLWCRDAKALDEFLAVAETLVAAGPRGLRATTRKLRSQAQRTGRDEHCGAHVSLLWDDPERIIDLYDRPAAPRPEVAT